MLSQTLRMEMNKLDHQGEGSGQINQELWAGQWALRLGTC